MTRYSVLVGLLVALGAGCALAQTKQPATAPAPASGPAAAGDPAQTTATYGDWVLRCVQPEKGPRICEVVQSMVVRGQHQPVAKVAVGYDKNDLLFTMLVPPAISLSRGPTLGAAGGATAPHFDLAWRRCLPNGCFADVAVGPELLETLRGRTEPMQIDFRDAGEREVKLPLSMRGLVPALDALFKEPR
ncbi:MAG: invasion associated locus B family protein [Proteobacteria bacterium]|nr:invasion associated locus B family protein [Pseudomonadota bacterium]